MSAQSKRFSMGVDFSCTENFFAKMSEITGKLRITNESWVKNAGIVCVLEAGQVVEQGPYTVLAESSSSLFFKMISSQNL